MSITQRPAHNTISNSNEYVRIKYSLCQPPETQCYWLATLPSSRHEGINAVLPSVVQLIDYYKMAFTTTKNSVGNKLSYHSTSLCLLQPHPPLTTISSYRIAMYNFAALITCTAEVLTVISFLNEFKSLHSYPSGKMSHQ
jgi:hypothetical protein